jgi:protein-S-isoprenylcysteine O-methyltransferase Ste14
MGASRFEYRFRYAIHGVIYALGFWSPWLQPLGMRRQDTWEAGMNALAGSHLLSFSTAPVVLLCVAIFFAGVGAFLRVWGSAYVGSRVVHSPSMHGEALLADGPYRRTRNPLYLGTLLHTFAVALIMPWSGAIFTIALIWIFQIRLALAEEPFLAAKFGESYLAYKERVPRFVPSVSPRVPAAGASPHWGQAALGEIYMIGVAITLLVFGWSFNVNTLLQGVLISLGLSLVMRAFVPRPSSS